MGKLKLAYFQTFKKLTQVKNFSETAEILGISQGTVSNQLKELEMAFDNVSLIDRSSKTFTITPAGELLLDKIDKILTLFDELEGDLSKFKGDLEQKVMVRISSSSIPGVYILPQLITSLRNDPQYTFVEFKTDITNSRDALNQLIYGAVDFCVVGSLFDIKESELELEIHEINEDKIKIISRIDHPICDIDKTRDKEEILNNLTKYPWIFREQGSATRDYFIKNWPPQHKINIALEFHDNMAIFNALAKSDALSALSSIIIDTIPSTNIVVHEFDSLPTISRNFYILRLKKSPTNIKVNKVWEKLIEIALQ